MLPAHLQVLHAQRRTASKIVEKHERWEYRLVLNGRFYHYEKRRVLYERHATKGWRRRGAQTDWELFR